MGTVSLWDGSYRGRGFMDWGRGVAMLTLGLFRQLLLNKAYCNVVNNYIYVSAVISIIVHDNRCITWDYIAWSNQFHQSY